jgi:predicted negative regulator of RcsB-dependent stress response
MFLSIAKIRLARVKGAMGDVEDAISELPSSFPESFTGLVEEARGDLLVLEGDWEAARSAYEAAASSEYVANRQGLTMKLNELASPDDGENSESTS